MISCQQSGDRIYIANAKGYGSGLHGGANLFRGRRSNNIDRLMKGTVSDFDNSETSILAGYTKKVTENNFLIRSVQATSFGGRKGNAIPLYAAEKNSRSNTGYLFPKKTGPINRS